MSVDRLSLSIWRASESVLAAFIAVPNMAAVATAVCSERPSRKVVACAASPTSTKAGVSGDASLLVKTVAPLLKPQGSELRASARAMSQERGSTRRNIFCTCTSPWLGRPWPWTRHNPLMPGCVKTISHNYYVCGSGCNRCGMLCDSCECPVPCLPGRHHRPHNKKKWKAGTERCRAPVPPEGGSIGLSICPLGRWKENRTFVEHHRTKNDTARPKPVVESRLSTSSTRRRPSLPLSSLMLSSSSKSSVVPVSVAWYFSSPVGSWKTVSLTL
jgi:hypothetical protein